NLCFAFVQLYDESVQIQNKDLTETLKVFNNQLEQTVSQRTRDLINKSNDLIKNQERFKSLYEYHPDPILTIDSNGIVLNINQAGSMLLGKESAALIGEECFSIFLDEDKSELESAIKKGKRCSSSSLQLRVKNNNEKDILFWYVTIVPIMIEGQAFGSYVMVKDITKM
ncbi:PAS domain S-box protein, partial [Bacillus sp. B-TM1]